MNLRLLSIIHTTIATGMNQVNGLTHVTTLSVCLILFTLDFNVKLLDRTIWHQREESASPHINHLSFMKIFNFFQFNCKTDLLILLATTS